jgi:hypothetical protein
MNCGRRNEKREGEGIERKEGVIEEDEREEGGKGGNDEMSEKGREYMD